ncbi:MAG: 1,4-alpha-glucan branching protein GlgB [Firmicutes bacterium]|nr:1,4-alpha-glucan branching protein GlgB [Bacillota bacterium]
MKNTRVYQQLSPELLYLFNKGKCYYAYEVFGAHLTDGGVQFTVWAPDAKSVKVVGDFNSWGMGEPELPFTNDDCYLKPYGETGVFSGFLPGLGEECSYKYDIVSDKGEHLMKADPFAFGGELRPDTASVVTDLEYTWEDSEWMKKRSSMDVQNIPLNIYEVHLGSWKRHPVEDGFYSYEELADTLVPYVKEMGYTHIEILPVMEHPLDMSWGYQSTGFYAPTSRYGKATGFMKLIDRCHQEGIGVIADWPAGHFCPDEQGLANFNGHPLFESIKHPQWGTYKFDFGRTQVRSFLLSNAVYWMQMYHIDGIRVDGVSSMLYLNFGMDENDPACRRNKDGGEVDLDAVDFLKEFNRVIGTEFPGTFTAAEESSTFPGITKPPQLGGLGFHYKWNMGWMNDTLDFCETDFIYRSYDHNKLTFAMSYAFSENFILPLSHDEVVHGKKSLLDKMPGDYWRKFAGLRALAMYQMTLPGKKLNFMGHENAPFIEWREYEELEWFLLQWDNHRMHRDYIKDLNHIYQENSQLWACDHSWDGFQWIDADNTLQNILSYIRMDEDKFMIVVLNMNVQEIDHFRIGVPEAGNYVEVINSDNACYGGNNRINEAEIKAEKKPFHGQPYSIEIKVPVLGGTIFTKKTNGEGLKKHDKK